MSQRKDIPWIHLLRVIACMMVVCLQIEWNEASRTEGKSPLFIVYVLTAMVSYIIIYLTLVFLPSEQLS